MNEKWQVVARAHGRTELAGNHVDHQGGTVLAATIDCACEIHMRARDDSRVHMLCDGFPDVAFDLGSPGALVPQESERFTTAALVRGCTAQLIAHGVPVRGFDAHLTSDIASGGGLSSSAAVELAIICGLDCLFGANDIPYVTRAQMGRTAECDFFGKPCGLMDQSVIAHGGIVAIDFADENAPVVEHICCNFESENWSMLLVDSHVSHDDETEAFSQIPDDMHQVAQFFDAERLHDVEERAFLSQMSVLRNVVGDRATLRALHYFNEDKLVHERINALKRNDIARFVALSQRSGISSAQYLQNISTSGSARQGAMVALACCDIALDGCGSARIHGGGFGGKIQVVLPTAHVDVFAANVDALLGRPSCQPVSIVDEKASAQWI